MPRERGILPCLHRILERDPSITPYSVTSLHGISSPYTSIMAKNKDALRDHAAWLYITQKLSLTEIKDRINIPLKTLSAWKKGRKGELDWDTRKRTIQSTPTAIKETLMAELERVAKGSASKIDADQLVKIASSMQKIDKQLSPQVITSALMLYENWLAKEDPQEAVRCLAHHKKFILYLIQTDGQVR
jgi:hypothetical protein